MNDIGASSLIDGRFEVISRLGSGGMGLIYLCRQMGFDRLVAVKLLQTEPGSLPAADAQLRFEREAQALSVLQHKSIIRIYGYGKHQGSSYIAMEFIDGRSLESMLSSHEPLKPAFVREIVEQICDALSCAHANGIIHRDLKPSNILIAKNGVVKLIDFGLAKLLPDTSLKNQQLTEAGTAVGSVLYMSPEQCVGQPADQRSDVYGLGCVIYHCLTGVPPFTGDHSVIVMHQQVNDSLPRLADVVLKATIAEGWQSILDVATAKDPSDRYQSTLALAEDVRCLSKSLPLNAVAKTVEARQFEAKTARSGKNLLFATVVAVLIVALSVVVFVEVNSPLHHQRLQSERQPGQSDNIDEQFKQHNARNLQGRELSAARWDLGQRVLQQIDGAAMPVSTAVQYRQKAEALFVAALDGFELDEALARVQCLPPSVSEVVKMHVKTALAWRYMIKANANCYSPESLALLTQGQSVLDGVHEEFSEDYTHALAALKVEVATRHLIARDWSRAEAEFDNAVKLSRSGSMNEPTRLVALTRLHTVKFKLKHPLGSYLESAIKSWDDMKLDAPEAANYRVGLDLIFDALQIDGSIARAERILDQAQKKLESSGCKPIADINDKRASIALARGQWLPAVALLDAQARQSALHPTSALSEVLAAYKRVFLLGGLGRQEEAAAAQLSADRIAARSAGAETKRRLYMQSLVALVRFFCHNGNIKAAERILDRYGHAQPTAEVVELIKARERGELRAVQ